MLPAKHVKYALDVLFILKREGACFFCDFFRLLLHLVHFLHLDYLPFAYGLQNVKQNVAILEVKEPVFEFIQNFYEVDIKTIGLGVDLFKHFL